MSSSVRQIDPDQSANGVALKMKGVTDKYREELQQKYAKQYLKTMRQLGVHNYQGPAKSLYPN